MIITKKTSRTNKILKNKIVTSFLLFLFLAVTLIGIQALPNPAAEFYGTVKINVTVDAPIGTNVSVYDSNNVLCGYFIVSAAGYYGLLSCNGDDTETPADEGATSSDSISFYVDGVQALKYGNASWGSGIFHEVNITTGNLAPTFNHSLANYTINESSAFAYDINCSDANGDNISYYDNISKFDIDSSTGIISWTPVDSDVGTYDVTVICSDGLLNTSGVFTIIVNDINNAPVLASIGSLIAVESSLFVFDVNATDADNDTLTYSSNATLFAISSTTGVFSFTPTISQVGNYSINFSVSDGSLTDFEIVSFRVTRGPYCGDSSCGSSEDCSSCSGDCGTCATAAGAAGTGTAAEGGAAEEGAEGAATRIALCVENWKCSDWAACSLDGFQKRKCLDINKCGTKKKKPTDIQVCEYIPTCSDNIQNGIETGVDCGGSCTPCLILPSCSDGIQNQDEAGVDCGGSCDPCEITKFAKLPELPQLAPLAKQFPWLLLLLVSILLSSTYLGDKVYVRRLKKKEIEDFRKKIGKYKKIRKLVYIAASILAFIALVFTFYVYLLSDKPELMMQFIWIPCLLIIIVSVAAFFVVKHLKYYEYKKREKEQQLLLTHKREKRNLIKLEDDILSDMEAKIVVRIEDYNKKKIFEESVQGEANEIASLLNNLITDRKIKMKQLLIDEKIKNLAAKLSIDNELLDMAKEYPEFKAIINKLKALDFGFKKNKENIDDIEGYLMLIMDIAADKHLISVVKSKDMLINLYNQLVDVYEYFKKELDDIKEKEEGLIKLEEAYCKGIDDITKDTALMETIKANAKYASLYNSLVDLFNHYKKRQELFNALKQAEHGQTE